MTRDDIEAGLAKIRKVLEDHDNEMAHVHEDVLHQAVFTAIRDDDLQGIDAREACRLALLTGDIDYGRWYA